MTTANVEIRLELHGDRTSGDAPEVHGGLTWVGSERYVAIEFGAEPLSESGARKATRLIRLAEQTSAPVLVVGRPQGVSTGVFTVVRALRAARVHVVLVGNDWGALENESHIEAVPTIPTA